MTDSGTSPKPNASSITAGLQSGETPLDFIQKNRKNFLQSTMVERPNEPAAAAAPVVPAPETPHPVAPPEVIRAIEQTSFADPFQGPLAVAPVAPETKAPEKPLEKATEPSAETDESKLSAEELLDRVRNKGEEKEESLRSLRKKTNEMKSTIEERDTAISSLKQQVEKYEKGEVVTPEVERLRTRNTELERYEQLHNLRMSPEYQQKFVQPLTQLGEQAAELALEYGVDPAIVGQALEMNKRERNLFLQKHFQDDVGALEARQFLEQIDEIRRGAAEADLEPGRKLEQLQEDFRKNELQNEGRRRQSIATSAEKGYSTALQELRQAGQFPMLALREGDDAHNQIARPILEAAATEYGKFTKLLAEAGMKELPEAASKILAKRWLISQAATIIAASGAQHYQRAEEVIREAERQASYVRPPVGGGGVRGNGNENGRPKTTSPESAAKEALRRVGITS